MRIFCKRRSPHPKIKKRDLKRTKATFRFSELYAHFRLPITDIRYPEGSQPWAFQQCFCRLPHRTDTEPNVPNGIQGHPAPLQLNAAPSRRAPSAPSTSLPSSPSPSTPAPLPPSSPIQSQPPPPPPPLRSGLTGYTPWQTMENPNRTARYIIEVNPSKPKPKRTEPQHP